jgi:hypothetical protein
MTVMQAIHIFRAGSHVAMSGQALEFSESDLAASAAAYDPAKHEAPITVGHPTHDAPAYGWVRSVSAGADGLTADPAQVDPAFAEMVTAGRFKKVSASFFAPGAKANPVPGVWYLRHVGFLGAQPPAVKGLRQAEFAEAAEDVVTVEFGEAGAFYGLKQFFTRFREWMLVNHGQDAADQVAPGYLADTMDAAARDEAGEDAADAALSPTGQMFSDPAASAAHQTQGVDMSDADKARLAELEAENATLKVKSAEFSERETRLAALETVARRTEIAAFIATQVQAGRVLPAEQAGMAAFMESLHTADVVEFGEGGDKVSKPAGDWLRDFVARLPARVDFSERARNGQELATADFAMPEGYSNVDTGALDVRSRALALQAANPKLNFIEAVKTAQKELV